MVFFVCEGCNESMKKNQVDKHAARCRTCHAVTCVDCSVTFYGNDYATHLVCVSEAEKYEKTLYKAKVITKMNPQEAWIALIEEAASRSDEAPSHVRQYVLRLNDLGNVPRNKGKFINFVKNSMKMNNTATMEEIWKFLELLKGEKEAEKTAAAAASTESKKSKSEKDVAVVESEDVVENADADTKSDEEAAAEKIAKKARKAERKRLREIEENVISDSALAAAALNNEIEEKSEKKKSKKNKKHKEESA